MKDLIKQTIGVSFGIFCIALSFNMMFVPNGIAPGGSAGFGIIVNKLFDINIPIFVLIINMIMLIIGLIFLGQAFFLKTVYGTLLLPFFLAIVPTIRISDDILLSVIFGALLVAIGMNIMYHYNASSGGTTIPPLLMKKYFGMNPALGLFISDAIVVLASLFLFGVEVFLYSILVIILTSLIMEVITNGLSSKKIMYIISNEIDEISDNIIKNVRRGVTRLHAQGAYSGREKDVLMVVVNNKDIMKIEKLAYDIDEKAFLIIQPVTKVTGQAFTYHSVVN